MNYGEKFKYVRELRQMTLSDLSKKCKLSIPYLSDIENNKKRPAMKSLERIAKALSVDPWFFMDETAVTFTELAKISNYEPPPDILEFVTNQEKLPYIMLAKKMSEDGISSEAWGVLIDNIKQMLKTDK